MDIPLKKNNGVTLVELLVALVISCLLIAAIYRTFIGQQKSYIIQEQVVDMQQNVRASVTVMLRELRMAGFGNITNLLPGGVSGFTEVITPGPDNHSVSIIGGFTQILANNGDEIKVSNINGNTITLDHLTDKIVVGECISIGGLESFSVIAIDSPDLDPALTDLTLNMNPAQNPVGKPLFQMEAITYAIGMTDGKLALQRNGVAIADNIENVQFEYRDENGNLTATPANIRMIGVMVTARTDMADPEFKGGVGGFRRRTITSSIKVRNMGLNL